MFRTHHSTAIGETLELEPLSYTEIPHHNPDLLAENFVTPRFMAPPWTYILLSCGRISVIPLFFVYYLGSSDNNPDHTLYYLASGPAGGFELLAHKDEFCRCKSALVS